MLRPNPHSPEDQKKLEELEVEMIALNVVKLKLTHALDILEDLDDIDHLKIAELLYEVLRMVMRGKMKAYEQIKEIAYREP